MNNSKTSVFLVVTNIILAAATVLLAFSTWKLVNETSFLNQIAKEQFFYQVRPMIVLDKIKSTKSPLTFYTEVKNLGSSEGYNIKVIYNMKAEVYIKDEDKITHQEASHSHEIDHLYPNQFYQNILSIKPKKDIKLTARASISYKITYNGKILGEEKEWTEEGIFTLDPETKIWLNHPK